MKRPPICLWKHVTRSDVESLHRAESAEDVCRALHRLLSPEESASPQRASALLHLYYHAARFCRDTGLSPEQTSCLLSIVKETHGACAGTSLGNVDECYQYFKELLLCHAVHRPPFSMAVFTQQQLPGIADYVLKTYFRHFKLYKYIFTPQLCLDLAVSYDDECRSAAQEAEENDMTDDGSAPGAEDDGKAERQAEGGPLPEPLAQQPSADVRDE